MNAVAVASSERPPITIDTREPDSLILVLRLLVAVDKVPTETTALGSADYRLTDYFGDTLGIERKTPADFVSSVADGRLELQLERMLCDYDFRLLVLHGHYGMDPSEKLRVRSTSQWRTTGMYYAAFQAKLLSIQQKYAVRVLTVGSDDEFAVLLRTLYRQGREGRFHV